MGIEPEPWSWVARWIASSGIFSPWRFLFLYVKREAEDHHRPDAVFLRNDHPREQVGYSPRESYGIGSVTVRIKPNVNQ